MKPNPWSFSKTKTNPAPKQPEPTDKPPETRSKRLAWNNITNASLNSNKYEKCIKIKSNMEFIKDQNVVICKCGSMLWKTKRCKAIDLLNHLETDQHEKALKEKAIKSKSASSLASSFKKDINETPLNFAHLYATFVAFYFIIIYNLPMYLITAFNKLLAFFKISNSGSSYVGRPWELLHSIYGVLKKHKTSKIKLSNWYFILFDESTTKSDPTSTLGISISYRDVETHKFVQEHLSFTEISKSNAESITNGVTSLVYNKCDIARTFEFLMH